jgi:hypothetical protein
LNEFLVYSALHSKFIKASGPRVAGKRFLNYLRRYTKDRPATVNIEWLGNKRIAAIEWYRGELRISSFEGAEGEWYKLGEILEVQG